MLFILLGIANSLNELQLNRSEYPPSSCPPPPTDDYFDLSQGIIDNYELQTIYGCEIAISSRVRYVNSAIFIYLCTFTKAESSFNGGAINIFIKAATSPAFVSEIYNCTFSECKSKEGGSIYIQNTRNDRSICINKCTFTNNRAESGSGGAIYVDVIYSNITNCTFKDNYATSEGQDIYYMTEERSTSGSSSNPLLIENCEFIRISEESKTSLVHLEWKSACDFSFNYNNIILPKLKESERIYFMDLGGINHDLGTMEATTNYITPSKAYFADPNSYLHDRIGDGFITSPNQPPPEVPAGCPLPPLEYEDLSEGIPNMKNINIYGCQIDISDRVNSDECCLYVHSCQFKDSKSNQKGGSIYILINSNTPTGDNHIENCTFSRNESPEGGSIYIESHESHRFLNIDNCTFKNNVADTKGGSICFYSTYCTINNSIFDNNYANSKGHEIYFEIFEHGDTEYPLLLDNNKFISNEENENQIKTGSIIYLEWRMESDFYFNNNEIRIETKDNNLFLFESNGDVSTGNLSCQNNCLIPSNQYLCKTNLALYNRIRKGFSRFCDPDSEYPPSSCPPPPTDDYFDLSQGIIDNYDLQTIYGCEIAISSRVRYVNSAIFIYLCTFTKVESSFNGGAINIFIKAATSPAFVSEIYNCTFSECKSKEGGSIYIQNTRNDRSICINKCTFTNNRAESGSGGAIYVDVIYSNITNCTFKDNYATSEGQDIYYMTEERSTSGSSSNPLLIENCEFIRISEESKTSLVHLEWKSACDFSFNYNNIILPKLKESERIYFMDLGGINHDLGTMEATTNYITPSKAYFADPNSYLHDRIGDGFITSPNQPPPEVPAGCPLPPLEYEDLSEGIPNMKNINIYGCQIDISDRVNSDECCLYVHSCQFKDSKSNQKGGSIYILINSNTPTGDNHIENCTFSRNESPEGGSIYIESHESHRFLNIDNCTFKNNVADTKGGSICFYSTYCTINNSIFDNNYANSKGHEIYFEIFEHGDTEYPLLLDNNKFISNEENENQIKTGSIIYLEWRMESDFYFNNNEIRIETKDNNLFLFESNGDVSTGNLSCQNNCLIPSNQYLCKTNLALYNRIRKGFSRFCDPDSEYPPSSCPPPPTDDYFDLSQGIIDNYDLQTIYGCEIAISSRVRYVNSAIFIYLCTFTKAESSFNGGAINIFIKAATSPAFVSEIYNCTFSECKSKEGGSIYIQNTRNDRSICINKCTFTNNRAESGSGGAIYVDVIYSNITNCTFKDNYATSEGQDIYYMTEERSTSGSSSNPLLIENCEFIRISEESKTSLVHLEWKSACDFSFNYNNIILPKLKESERIYFMDLGGINHDLGTMEATTNYITPSKAYFADPNSYLHDRIGDGFITSPNQPPPEVPAGCPLPPLEYEDLSEGIPNMKNINIYGCQIDISDRVNSDECCLYVHSCQFKDSKSNQKGGSIYILINSNTPTGDNHIENCTFSRNESPEGGSIYIESHESHRFLNIDNCTFKNNVADTKGGSICFYSTYCTINNSIFDNNYANSKGHEIYFEIFEHGDTEYPLLLDNNKFISNEENENQIKTGSIIYLEWRMESDFYFNNNEIRIETKDNNLFLFESNGDVSTGNLSCQNNCLIPSNQYLCDISKNQALYDRTNSGFSDFCDPQPIIPSDTKDNISCTQENHCETIINNPIFSHVNVIRTEFNGFHHEDNGGAIHMINTGLTVLNGIFTECQSSSGGGGGIFIYNELDIPNRYDLKNLQFINCKAAFGGGIYIYSLSEKIPANIESCNFEGNEVFDNKANTNGLFGGSAICLTIKCKSSILNSKFKRNIGRGGSCKIDNNFDNKPKNNNNVFRSNLLSNKRIRNNDASSSLIISNCNFEMNDESSCSIYYVQGKTKSNKAEVKNCVFSGNLDKNAHYIDGEFNGNDVPNLKIQECRFSSDKKGAVNDKILKMISNNHIYFNKENNNSLMKSSFTTWAAVAASAVIVLIIVAALIVEKKKDSNKQTFDITYIKDDIENNLSN